MWTQSIWGFQLCSLCRLSLASFSSKCILKDITLFSSRTLILSFLTIYSIYSVLYDFYIWSYLLHIYLMEIDLQTCYVSLLQLFVFFCLQLVSDAEIIERFTANLQLPPTEWILTPVMTVQLIVQSFFYMRKLVKQWWNTVTLWQISMVVCGLL